MASLVTSLARAVGQLADPAILRVLAKSIVMTLVIFAVLGIGGFALLEGLLESWAGDFSDEVAALAAVLTVAIGGWLLFRIVALAVIQLFAEDIVRAVEARYYPDAAASARTVPWREGLADGARSALRALGVNLLVAPVALVLLVTGVGTVLLFWGVNGWLIGRELQELAWARHRPKDRSRGRKGHRHDRREAAPIGGGTQFLLGGAIAALLAVPFANLFAPVIGAAAATHLVQSAQIRKKRNA